MSNVSVFCISAAILLGIIEAATVNLITIWFAIGAFAAFCVSFFTENIFVLAAVFVVGSAVSLAFTRPLVKKYVKGLSIATNADRIIGKEAVVIEKVDNILGCGQIKIMGQVWSAKARDGNVINSGESVIISKIEGVHAVVYKKTEG